jgi:hypothetical protein
MFASPFVSTIVTCLVLSHVCFHCISPCLKLYHVCFMSHWGYVLVCWSNCYESQEERKLGIKGGYDS